jgi:hypothetical protein
MKIEKPSPSHTSRTRGTLAKRGMRWAALWLTLVAPLGVVAQQTTTAPGNNAQTVEQLIKQLADLEMRIKELEARETTRVSPAPSTSSLDATDKAEDQTAEGSRTRERRLQVHGFGELEIGRSLEKGNNNSSASGELEMLISSRLSNRLTMLGDIEVTAASNTKVSIELERLLLRYSPSEHLILSAGRYFTSIGYYNSAHRGTWLQTAVDPPFSFESEDEGGILPVHNVGVSANGVIPSGSLGLRYIAEIGAAHTSRTRLDQPDEIVVDEHNSVAFNFGLLARPVAVPGLQAGFSIYRDRLAPAGAPKIGQTIMAVHLVYRRPAFEMLNEALVVRHAMVGESRVFNTTSFYTQVSRQFGKYTPYFRYEYVNAPDLEPLFSDVGRRNGPSFGLRYDLGEFMAFKAQYDHTARRLLNPVNVLTLQFSFAF